MIVFSFLYGLKHLTIFQYNEFGRTMILKGKHSGGFLKNYFLEIIHNVLNIQEAYLWSMKTNDN